MKNTKNQGRKKRHDRIRVKMKTLGDRPRLIVHRGLRNLTASVVDDKKNQTLFSMSTHNKEIKAKFPYAGNIRAAVFFGEVFASRLKEKGITKINFDRAGYLYHGRVKAFAESLRKAGLEF